MISVCVDMCFRMPEHRMVTHHCSNKGSRCGVRLCHPYTPMVTQRQEAESWGLNRKEWKGDYWACVRPWEQPKALQDLHESLPLCRGNWMLQKWNKFRRGTGETSTEKSTGSCKDCHLLLMFLSGASDWNWEDEQASGGTWVILMEIGAYGRNPEHWTATALAQPPLTLLGMT